MLPDWAGARREDLVGSIRVHSERREAPITKLSRRQKKKKRSGAQLEPDFLTGLLMIS